METIESLPVNLDAERFILGSVLMDDSLFVQAATAQPDDFSLDKHRKIFHRMMDLHQRGEKIERLTVATELSKHRELDSCDGLSYLVSLDDQVPQVRNVDSYVRILKEKSTLRKIISAAQQIALEAASPSADPCELLARSRDGLLQLADGIHKSTLVSTHEVMQRAGGMDAYLNRQDQPVGLTTGYPALDRMIGGLRPGAMYVIGARPRMGKTAFALNLTEKVSVDHGESTLFFSIEMTKEQLVDRLICSRARVNTRRFETGRMDRDESRRVTRAAGEIANSGILIDDKGITSPAEIHSKIRQQQQRTPVGMVVIDYLQRMIGGDARNRVAEASRISTDIANIAKDCKVPVITLSQLNRACDDRDNHRPTLSDLRDTGAIEQDANVVMFMYRDEVYYPDRPELHGLAELIIEKQREGPVGKVDLVWQGEIVRFEERLPE